MAACWTSFIFMTISAPSTFLSTLEILHLSLSAMSDHTKEFKYPQYWGKRLL